MRPRRRMREPRAPAGAPRAGRRRGLRSSRDGRSSSARGAADGDELRRAFEPAPLDRDPVQPDLCHRRRPEQPPGAPQDAETLAEPEHVEALHQPVPAGLEAALPVELDLVEVASQQRLEVRSRELDVMERVVRLGRRRVGLGRRDQVGAAGPEDAGHLAQVRVHVGQVLDRLEGTDDVERRVGKVEIEQIADAELHAGNQIVHSCISDRAFVPVDAQDSPCLAREERAPVADAAARVEDLATAAPGKGELVPLEVQRHDAGLRLVRDDALGVRQGAQYPCSRRGSPPTPASRRGDPGRDPAHSRHRRARLELVAFRPLGRAAALAREPRRALRARDRMGARARRPAAPVGARASADLRGHGCLRRARGRVRPVVGRPAADGGADVLVRPRPRDRRRARVGRRSRRERRRTADPLRPGRGGRGRARGPRRPRRRAASGSRGALGTGALGTLALLLATAHGNRARLLAVAGVAVAVAAAVGLAEIPQPNSKATGASPTACKSCKQNPYDADRWIRLEDDLDRPASAGGPGQRRTLFASTGRGQAWEGAIDQGGGRPVAGFGFGTEDHVFVDRYYSFFGGSPENSYIGMFLPLGLVGVALLLVLAASLVAASVTAVWRLGDRERRLVAACGAVLLTGLGLAVVQSSLYAVGNTATLSIWTCAFLGLALAPRAAPR